MPTAKRVPYFHRRSTHELIVDLAGTPDLTLIIGAGWSADWGLPRWDALLRRMLQDKVAPAYGIHSDAERDSFADAILDTHYLIGSASIVRESLDDFYGALANSLYMLSRGRYGASAWAISKLVLASQGDRRLRILTTNYDYSLEDAIGREKRDGASVFKARTISTWDDLTKLANVDPETGPAEAVQAYLADPPEEIIPVFHLHGALDPAGIRRGDIVFSEEDYLANRTASNWQDELLQQCLTAPESRCLFVGMQLSDPNVVRQLFRTRTTRRESEDGAEEQADTAAQHTEARRVAVMPLQGDDHWHHDDAVAEHIERAIRKRLARLGINKVAPDFFSQAPQLITEVANCRAAMNEAEDEVSGAEQYLKHHRYGLRLRGWRELMHDENGMSVDDDHTFERAQEDNHDVLKRFRTVLYQALEDERVDRYSNERFGVVLWARNPEPDQTSLELWGSSERAWLERETILAPPIEDDSLYAAVRAFCAGPSVLEPTRKEGSRWALGTSVVIRLGGGYDDLPVGVLILESNFELSKSSLTHLGPERRRELQEAMAALGEAMLLPGLPVLDLKGPDYLFQDPTKPRALQRIAKALRERIRQHHSDWVPTFEDGHRAKLVPAGGDASELGA